MKRNLHKWILNTAFATVMLFSANSWSQLYYNLQWPASGSIMEATTHDVYAQAYEPGVTEAAGPADGLEAWIGVSPQGQNTNPSTWTMWIPATFNVQAGNNDEFRAAIGSNLAPGTYYYASRFRLNNGSFVYGGYNGGAWNGTSNVSGALNVTSNPSCDTVWYADADGDGYGGDDTKVACNQPEGYVSDSSDCDDDNATVWETRSLFVDNDLDGYYGGVEDVCIGDTIPDGYYVGTNGTDCNDNDPSVFNNADVYVDSDGDHYTDGPMADVCYGDTLPAGLSTYSLGNDCDDTDATVWETRSLFFDNDSDGYYGGVENVCIGDTIPAGYSIGTSGTDCNDNDPTVFNNADVYVDNDGDHYTDGPMADVCYGDTLPAGLSTYSLGNDCDDTDPTKWHIEVLYVDNDGDGYHGQTEEICIGEQAPAGYSLTTNGVDCDDTNAAINPNAGEITGNGIDENCNGNEDDGVGEFLTQLKPSQCGSTLDRIYNALVAVVNTPNVTEYYFEITNTSNNAKQTINGDNYYFQLTDLASYEYETVYSVRVGMDVAGVWQGYGPACLVTSPSLSTGPSAIVIPQCGTTLAQRFSPISITGPTFISSYDLLVTNLSTMEAVTLTRTQPFFSLKMVPSIYEYSTDYSIQVRVATTEGYSEYSAPCTVSTPAGSVSARNAETAPVLTAVAYPNPFVDAFTVNLSNVSDGRVSVKVYDMVGKLLEVRDVNPSTLQSERLGTNFPAGVYNVILTQDGASESIRVIKR